MKCAPIVRCTTWGHPVTTGIDAIDYFISSEALETEEAYPVPSLAEPA
jgi:protein O-GlcNAc transferase